MSNCVISEVISEVMPIEIPEEILNMLVSYLGGNIVKDKENIYKQNLDSLKTETTEAKYEILLSHYINEMKSYKTLYNEKLYDVDKVTKETLDGLYGDYDFYKYDEYVNLQDFSTIENLYLYSEQEVLELRSIPVNIKKIILNFPNLIRIEDGFLDGCDGLVEIDLSGSTALISIGDDFLLGCSNLTEVDFGELTGLTSIGNQFLGGCERLVEIDLSGLTALTSIGDYFLSGCRRLVEIDMSGLKALTSIGGYFLRRCTGLTSVMVIRESI